MKKILFCLLLFQFLLCAAPAYGVRAYPHPKRIVQSDGTEITLLGHGDEYSHHVTTVDGYSVVRGFDGVFRYAVERDGRLHPTEVKASDPESRGASELDFLYKLERHAAPAVTSGSRRLMGISSRNDGLFSSFHKTGDSGRGFVRKAAPSAYRGLVVMVNFTDRKFSRGDNAHQLVDDMMNQEDRLSYDDPLLRGRISCSGSVRDYFDDNSGGAFVPDFDVVGPVEIDVDQYYIMGTERTYELSRKVLEAADAEIDYTRYDSDGDGTVDMVYFLYAGYASSYQGNDERLIWPHAGHFADAETGQPGLDGVRFGRFASSAELFGWHDDGDLFLDGIGVIVHEFSHVLGFKDHYDVSGYLNEDPGIWDVMAAGNYNGNLNDTPCGYNSYEKYSAGFLTPKTVSEADCEEELSLFPLSQSGDALRIVSMQDSTVFMLENRQLEKWDRYLPGHGMLVWRVDSCDNEYWEFNALNVNGRLHFKLIRAAGAEFNIFRELEDTDHDPFPGSRGVSALTNSSKESDLLSIDGYPSPYTLHDIKENNGIISFTVKPDKDAKDSPYTFSLCDSYAATGENEDGEQVEWQVRTGVMEAAGRERPMIYDLVPDTRGIASTDPKYADGLGVAYALSGDRKNVYIEPYRVAVMDNYGVWLVDFNDLDNGGSGAIVLDMNPYGEISLTNPESILGYCLIPRTSPLVIAEDIVERFSMVRNIMFGVTTGMDVLTPDKATRPDSDEIFNLQGIKVTQPKKGEIYIVNGRKSVY